MICSIILALVLAGCGGGEPDPGDTVVFPQSVTSLNGTISVGYPNGWVTQIGEEQFVLANSDAALTIADIRTLTADQIYGTISVIPNTSLGGLDLSAESTPRQFLDAILSRGGGPAGARTNIDNRQEFRMGGHDAIITRGTIENNDIRYGSIFALIKYSGAVVLLNFNTAADATENYVDVVEEIARSVIYPATATP